MRQAFRLLLGLWSLAASLQAQAPLGVQHHGSGAIEHARSLWTERANRVHRAFAEATSAQRDAALARLGEAQHFPDVFELSAAWHALSGLARKKIDHPLQRLVDSLDVQVRPGVLGSADEATQIVGLVRAFAPVNAPREVFTELVWKRGEVEHHGRRETIGGSNFSRAGFVMYLESPPSDGDPHDWTLVPSVHVAGETFVGMPVDVPRVDAATNVPAPELELAHRRWLAEGRRSYGSFDALRNSGPGGKPAEGAPLRLGPDLVVWRRSASGARRATIFVTTHDFESRSGPLTGWLGQRWNSLVEAGFELVALPPDTLAHPALREHAGDVPAILVLRGDAGVRWLFASGGRTLDFDGFVLAQDRLEPLVAQFGETPTKIVSGALSPFVEEPRLPSEIAGWIDALVDSE